MEPRFAVPRFAVEKDKKVNTKPSEIIIRNVILHLEHDWKAWTAGTKHGVTAGSLAPPSVVERPPASLPENPSLATAP